jgi:uncharacterized protein YdiU (UPF0061 family)
VHHAPRAIKKNFINTPQQKDCAIIYEMAESLLTFGNFNMYQVGANKEA